VGCSARVLVLGLSPTGETFGPRCLEALTQRFRFEPHVRLGAVSSALEAREVDKLLVFEAFDFGGQPGTLKLLRGVHGQALAERLGLQPHEVTLIGLQLDERASRAPPSIDDALTLGLQQLTVWGCGARPRPPELRA
jgi:hydrogenase maturation protease